MRKERKRVRLGSSQGTTLVDLSGGCVMCVSEAVYRHLYVFCVC